VSLVCFHDHASDLAVSFTFVSCSQIDVFMSASGNRIVSFVPFAADFLRLRRSVVGVSRLCMFGFESAASGAIVGAAAGKQVIFADDGLIT